MTIFRMLKRGDFPRLFGRLLRWGGGGEEETSVREGDVMAAAEVRGTQL